MMTISQDTNAAASAAAINSSTAVDTVSKVLQAAVNSTASAHPTHRTITTSSLDAATALACNGKRKACAVLNTTYAKKMKKIV